MTQRGNVASRTRQVVHIELAEKIQTILGSKGLTLYQASQQSSALFGRSSPFFLPHNLYYELRRGTFIPSVYQLLAFSRISGYRMHDWFRVFGIDLEKIPRLQVLLPHKRTIIIDTSLTETQDWVPWFRNNGNERLVHSITPLAQMIEPGIPRRIGSISRTTTSLYVKVGSEDAFGFPDIVPGSVVKIDPVDPPPVANQGEITDRPFLIEHSRGFVCARFRVVEENIIVPIGNELAFAQVELRLPSETRVLGAANVEFQSLGHAVRPSVPRDLAWRWTPEPIHRAENFGQLLNRVRRSANLSLREAAAMTRAVSVELGARARISPSSLCDYEVMSTAPRDLHKIVSLCCLYGLRLRDLLIAAGISLEQSGREPMADNLVGRSPLAGFVRDSVEAESSSETGFLKHLAESFGDIPLFMRNVVAAFAGLPRLSIDDFFWMRNGFDTLHPYLRNGLIAVVNRRRKTPVHFASKPIWKQPIYMLLRRDGNYACACCSLEGDKLIIHPYTEQFHRNVEFHYRKDIEVIGQVVAIARSVA